MVSRAEFGIGNEGANSYSKARGCAPSGSDELLALFTTTRRSIRKTLALTPPPGALSGASGSVALEPVWDPITNRSASPFLRFGRPHPAFYARGRESRMGDTPSIDNRAEGGPQSARAAESTGLTWGPREYPRESPCGQNPSSPRPLRKPDINEQKPGRKSCGSKLNGMPAWPSTAAGAAASASVGEKRLKKPMA